MLIYLVDDDFISLFLTEQVIRIEKFADNVRAFGSGEAALAALLLRLETEVPDVIFLDLNMPVMSGWDFLDALAPHLARLQGRCAIYLLTSSLALADTAKAKEYALVANIIHKPLDEEDLRAIQAQARAAVLSSYTAPPPPLPESGAWGARRLPHLG